MKDLLVIYHGNCADGFGAAWVVWNALGPEVEFFPGTYQSAPPDCTDRNVLMVDFSYKRPVIDMIAQVARSIVILDHHKSAKEDLEPFAVQECGEGRLAWADIPSMLRDLEELNRPPILALFDMERSGAMITWDVFNPGQKPPQLLRHIQDRDLWRFELEGTREIQAALFSYPYDFRTWDLLMVESGIGREHSLFQEGVAIERKHFKDVSELINVVTRWFIIEGYRVPIANLPYIFTSDAGHMLAVRESCPFAGCYWDTPEGRVFSLRSVGDFDVSAIAKKYGGGGHRNASGFRVSFDQAREMEAP